MSGKITYHAKGRMNALILAGILSFFFGAAQAFLLKKALTYILGADYMKAALFFLIKTLLFALAAVALVLWLRTYLVACAIGFGAGLPAMIMIYFACKTFVSGGDQNENADNH